jgi:O-antigen ligase
MNFSTIDSQFTATDKDKKKNIVIVILAFLLALAPFLGAVSPRVLVAIPPIFAILFYWGHCFLLGARPVLNRNLILVFIALLLLPTLSVLWAIDADIALDRIWKNILTIFPAAVFLSVLQGPLGEKILPVFCKILPLTLLAGLLITAVNLNGEGIIYSAFRGFELDSGFNLSVFNRSVVVTTLCFFCGVYALKHSGFSQIKKTMIGACLLILLLDVFYLTHSQSAHLAFALAFFPFLFFPVRSRLAWVILWLILSALLMGAPWLAQYLFDAYPRSFSELDWFKNSYALERLEIWDFVSRYALGNPLYGFGIEATKAVKAFDTQKIYVHVATILHPHNFALQLWIEFGIIGILACAGFFATLFKAMYEMKPAHARLSLALFIGVLSVSATGYGLWQGWWLGLMILMAAYVVVFSHHNDQNLLS